MDLITGGISGADLQTGYIGPFVGAPAVVSVDSDNAVNQYQLVFVDVSGFTESISSVTLNGVDCVVTENDPTDDQIQVRVPGTLATGTYTMVVSGATETATITGVDYTQIAPFTSPVGDVDSNSGFSSPIKITPGTFHWIESGPSNGTLDSARAEAEGLWANDITDIYTPNVGFTGEDFIVFGLLFDDGTTDTITATITVEAQVDTDPDAFTVDPLTNQALDQWVEFPAIEVTGIDAGEEIAVSVTGTDVQYAVDAGAGFAGFTAATTNVQLGYLVKPRIRTANGFEVERTGSLAIGSQSSSLSATTRAAVLPTLDSALPDLNLGQGDAVSVDLDNYFSGASSYGLSGLPSNSGLEFDGSVLSGTTNVDDIEASPFTLVATAYSSDGSIQDSFDVTVIDDIAPAVTINPLTTLDTTPVASGSAGDATSLTLDVEGVDVTHSSTYSPTISSGSWTQQLNELAIGTYTMTATGVDDAGNETVVSATLKVVEQIATSPRGLFQPLFRSLTGSVNQTLFR